MNNLPERAPLIRLESGSWIVNTPNSLGTIFLGILAILLLRQLLKEIDRNRDLQRQLEQST